jgi:hypothetical protein
MWNNNADPLHVRLSQHMQLMKRQRLTLSKEATPESSTEEAP